MNPVDRLIESSDRRTLGEAPEGFDALVLGDLARRFNGRALLHIARDDTRLAATAEALAFFAGDARVLRFPAWDCLPYDRVSPHAHISSQRMATLAALCADQDTSRPLIVLTTLNAALQRVPARHSVASNYYAAHVGNKVDVDAITRFLSANGFVRTGTVREAGDYAVRGGIVDIFPPGFEAPLRLDLFGDTLESIRVFNPEDQRTTGQRPDIFLAPACEAPLDPEAIARFRTAYVTAFGAITTQDPLYEAVSEGRKYPGMEHWLPLFHEKLETLFDYLPNALLTLDYQIPEALAARFALVQDFYEARLEKKSSGIMEGGKYKPLPPERLYLTSPETEDYFNRSATLDFSPFSLPEGATGINMGARRGRNFSAERQQSDTNVFEALIHHIHALHQGGKRVVLACWSEGGRERLHDILQEHGMKDTAFAENREEIFRESAILKLVVLGMEEGFETEDLALISEQDVLGDRLVRRHRRKRADNFLSEVSSLKPGDLVVHLEHGIGRFEGLETIDVAGAPHDCLLLAYQGNDKLYLPVENIELLSRYGSEDAAVQLDRLGGAGWQARKARMKKHLLDMAGELIKIAAARALRDAPSMPVQNGPYGEFCARFPYELTEDQEQTIDSVLEDLNRNRPMDRLVCGDVGFGKTEVALRAAFTAALAGYQVALVTPTTLLTRQHYGTFRERFSALPIKIRQLSRLVPAKEAARTKEELANGQADIVIGTHALLSKSIRFRNLGLIIIDEEQHFGVKHKERLKQIKSDIHVLTLTATPIPRTLQLALSGVRELSLITTPPVDRLAVRTHVTPFDPVVIREALLREHYRGGQSFYVCPRIADLPDAEEFLKEYVPEVKYLVAHGQMNPGEIEDKMTAFYDGHYNVLLSTVIVESGLDIPAANTMIIHRSDRFGLAQLYQLRGRVGRSKSRAYACLTIPPTRVLTPQAQKRLEVLQSLDSLGAGFSLASHDLDIRGAGNLLGEEQSGQIREVGYELYQSMLEEAVAASRGEDFEQNDDNWSPRIDTGVAVLIPENYVPDLQARMALYRRLSQAQDRREIDTFAAELIDRFGPLPEEVSSLLRVVEIKILCRVAMIEKINAGPKGLLLSLRHNRFPNPAGLVELINSEKGKAKVRPDHMLIFRRNWPLPGDQLEGAWRLVKQLSEISTKGQGGVPSTH